MLLESLVKATVELQGCRVVTVTGDAGGLVADLVPDRRFAPRCGRCGTRGWYRDTRPARHFRHVPLWGIPGRAALCAAARAVSTMRRRPCRVDALGQWKTADDPRAARDARNVGPGVALAAGCAVVPVLVGPRGYGR